MPARPHAARARSRGRPGTGVRPRRRRTPDETPAATNRTVRRRRKETVGPARRHSRPSTARAREEGVASLIWDWTTVEIVSFVAKQPNNALLHRELFEPRG